MNKSIFNAAVAVTAVAVFSVGCSEKPDDDGQDKGEQKQNDIYDSNKYGDPSSPYYSGGASGSGLEGDWMLVSLNQNYAPEYAKHFWSITSSTIVEIRIQKGSDSDFWSEEQDPAFSYSVNGNSICVYEECAQYNISGNTLTVSAISHGESIIRTFVRGNLANVKKTLGLSKSTANLEKISNAENPFKAFRQ